MNDNLGEHHYGGMEDVRQMLEFRGIISRDLVNNPYIRQDYLTSEEIKINISKHNDIHMIVKLTTSIDRSYRVITLFSPW